jgi:hypothetical protein
MQNSQRIVLSEIDQQCRFALLAYHDATVALGSRQAERFWYSMQALVNAATSASRLLWPSARDHQPLAEELRRSLNITVDSVLSPAKLGSQADEDHPLFGWVSSVSHREVSPSNFGPGHVASSSPEHCARFLDPDESVFGLFGRVFDSAAVMRAVAELHEKTRIEMHRLETLM